MSSYPTTADVSQRRDPISNASRPKVVVIGAGPYGLAVASHLAALGVQARVFGDPMATWRRHMPEGMFLKSTPSASSISAPEPGFTLMDYCDHIGTPRLPEDQPVPIDLFERYGLWFQQRLVSWVEQERVCRVASNGNGFHVALETGEHMTADAVVVATGLMSYAHTPEEFGASAIVTHSSHHRDLSAFAGDRGGRRRRRAVCPRDGCAPARVGRPGSPARERRPPAVRPTTRPLWSDPPAAQASFPHGTGLVPVRPAPRRAAVSASTPRRSAAHRPIRARSVRGLVAAGTGRRPDRHPNPT